jgi:hypothetical protein
VVHLLDAAATAEARGRVALGSDAFDLFERLARAGAVGTLPVYLVASRTGHDGKTPPPFEVNKVHFRGRLAAITPADRRRRHPDPTIRPASAVESDGGWALFWEVADLARIDPPLALEKFATRTGQRWLRVPEGPVEANTRFNKGEDEWDVWHS